MVRRGWTAPPLPRYFSCRTPGPGLAAIPMLVVLTTWGTLAVELAFLPLVFLPVANQFGRWIGVALAAGLHVGILLLLNVGNFPVVMLSLLVLFVPGSLIERLFHRLGASAFPMWHRDAGKRRTVRAETAVVLAMLAATSLGSAVPRWPGDVLPPHASTFAVSFLGLLQTWDMFAPDPIRSDDAIVVSERFADGTVIEFVPGRPSLQTGESATAADPFFTRWQKVTERLTATAWADYRGGVGEMYCHSANALGQAPVEVTLTDVVRTVGVGNDQSESHQIWSAHCQRSPGVETESN